MSQIRIDSEDVAEIRNALCVIQLNAEAVGILGLKGWRFVLYSLMLRLLRLKMFTEEIVKQVKRIDNLLPQVKFEG